MLAHSSTYTSWTTQWKEGWLVLPRGTLPKHCYTQPNKGNTLPRSGLPSQPSKGRTHNPARVFSRSASIDYHSGGAAAPQLRELDYSRPTRGHSHQLKKGECMSPRDIDAHVELTLIEWRTK